MRPDIYINSVNLRLNWYSISFFKLHISARVARVSMHKSYELAVNITFLLYINTTGFTNEVCIPIILYYIYTIVSRVCSHAFRELEYLSRSQKLYQNHIGLPHSLISIFITLVISTELVNSRFSHAESSQVITFCRWI
jgi:hypothetical protein